MWVIAAVLAKVAASVEKAPHHYLRTRLILAVLAERAARTVLLVSWASPILVARSAKHRLTATATVPGQQAVQC